jgi:hypothetical protein
MAPRKAGLHSGFRDVSRAAIPIKARRSSFAQQMDAANGVAYAVMADLFEGLECDHHCGFFKPWTLAALFHSVFHALILKVA